MNCIHRIANGLRFMAGLTILYLLIRRTIYSWNDEPAIFYFTVLSNLLLAILFVSSPFINNVLLFDKLRGPITLYLMVTSIIYLTILDPIFTKGLYSALNLKTISSSIHHITMVTSLFTHIIFPAFILLDFLLFSQPRKITKYDVGLALTFPLAYVCFHTIYGLMTGTYLYPFLDPSILGSFSLLFLVVIGLTGVFSLLYHGLHLFRNKLQNFIYDDSIKSVMKNLYRNHSITSVDQSGLN